jgi:hypothetical protein
VEDQTADERFQIAGAAILVVSLLSVSGCGDTIIFTFTHSDVTTDFEITVTVEGQ